MRLSHMLFRSLGRRLPLHDGEIRHRDVSSSITVRRDANGVPHINAENDPDAWFGLGFCHGQDRSFQLEVILRIVRGTLSELVGADGLSIDRLSRRLGISRAAEAQVPLLDEDIREMFVAFAKGVNAGRDAGSRRQAHEFSLLRSSPSPWTESDPLGFLKFTSFLMSTNWGSELARYQILMNDGIEALEALEAGRNSGLVVTSPPGARAVEPVVSLVAEARRVARELGLELSGSNNWVVSGERTSSGRPILANDTHLAPVLPGQFYLAHLATPEWSVAGGSFAGVPGFFLGHNGHAAWGVTIGYLDNTDLFIEETSSDGRSVREGDGYVQCASREERIAVKGSDDVVERVLVTSRGPIVGPPVAGEQTAISIAATWLLDLPLRSLSGAHRWRSFGDFRRDLNQHPNVSLNVVYADLTGDIGWKLAGDLPVRSGSGSIPLPAADPGNHWKPDLRPPDMRLELLNPETGYIATANSRPVSDPEGAGFGVDWAEGYRLTRIDELLQGREGWTTDDMWDMQLDTESLPWRELKPIIERVRPVDGDSNDAKKMLLRWDGNVSRDSTSAALFELCVSAVIVKIAERAAPVSVHRARNRNRDDVLAPDVLSLVRTGDAIQMLQLRPGGWFEHGWDAVLANSLGDALRTLRSLAGVHTRRWQWGLVRPLTLPHRLGQGPMSMIFNRGPFHVGGDTNTIHAAGVNPLNPLGPDVRSIATARTVIEIGDWDNARFILLGGQSGNPLSPNYDDQIPLWLQGKGVPIAWTPAAVEKATRSTLTLLPAG